MQQNWSKIKMKTIITLAIAALMIFMLACHARQNKHLNQNDSLVVNPAIEEPANKKEEKIPPHVSRIPPESLAKEILTTSARFKELTKGLYLAVVKNGGLSYGVTLEGSPEPKKDKAWTYSKTFDFTVFELYPNRQLNIARFSYNPDENQLYEYNAVKDKMEPIAFDRNLLLEWESHRK